MKSKDSRVLLVGFPSEGAVGMFAISFLIEKAKLEFSEGLEFPEYSPMFFVDKGRAIGPIRIFKKDNIHVAFTTIPLDVAGGYYFAKAIGQYAKKNNIDEIIIPKGLQSIGKEAPDTKSFGLVVGNSGDLSVEKFGLEKMNRATILGAEAGMISELKVARIPSLFVYTLCKQRYPDVQAIEKMIKILSKIIGTDVDVGDVKKTINKVRKQSQEMIKAAKEATKKDFKKPASMYR